jgi:hypothetical protein
MEELIKNQNVHQLDSESFETLKGMITSKDEHSVNLGIALLVNCDTNDKQTLEYLDQLANSSVSNLSELPTETMRSILDFYKGLMSNGLIKL